MSSSVGRSARALRTREAVIDALEALVREGVADPGARLIAERADVSARSVFAHFASLEDLHQALAARGRQRVMSLLRPIDPLRPLAERIADLCTQRGRVAEEVGPLRRAAAARAGASPTLAAAREEGRRASYEQVRRVFAPELDRLDAAARARTVAAVDVLISGEAWDLVRSTHGLALDDATAATTAAVTAVLTSATSGVPGAAAAVDAPAAARRAEAEVALADANARIARLVAAVEAGAPPATVAPRLTALEAARTAALGVLGHEG